MIAELATAEERGYRYLYTPDEDGDDQRVLVGQLAGAVWDRRR